MRKESSHVFHQLSSGRSIFHRICDRKHLVTGNCSSSWAELRYMVCSGVQRKGRGEETQGGVICCTSVNGFTSLGEACTSWKSVESAGPSGTQALGLGPKFVVSHAQRWVEHLKLFFLFKNSNTNLPPLKLVKLQESEG